MILREYLDACEELWSDWHAGRCDRPIELNSFRLEDAPQPYLRIGRGTRPLYVLLTNPGEGKARSDREKLKKRLRSRPYWEAALELGGFNRECLVGAARHRMDALSALSKAVGTDCIVQFESIPFHSKKLPGKKKLVRIVQQCSLLSGYVSALRKAVRKVSVFAISGVDSTRSIDKGSISRNNWLRFQAELLGVNPDSLKCVPLTEKRGKVTSAYLYQRINECKRGFLLMMGSNGFPGPTGRDILARELRS